MPPFALLEPGMVPDFPFLFFIKPIKSISSVGAFQIDGRQALQSLAPRASLPAAFFEPLEQLMERYVVLDRKPSQPNTGAGSGHFRCNEYLMNLAFLIVFLPMHGPKPGFS